QELQGKVPRGRAGERRQGQVGEGVREQRQGGRGPEQSGAGVAAVSVPEAEPLTGPALSYADTTTKTISAANSVDFAYRELGEGELPLVLFQHFRGNLDNWDPALIEALAASRPVVTFDNTGVGSSSGVTPSTISQMTLDALAFLDALEYEHVDVLGFSIGSFVAQELSLIRPALVRRLVLASAAPRGASGMHGWAPDVIAAVGGRRPNPEGYLS